MTLQRYVTALLIVACIGCSAENQHGYVKTEGQLTINSGTQAQTDLVDASLTFLPLGSDGKVAYAMTDQMGSFQVQTGNQLGMLPGRYRVMVQKNNVAELNIPDPLPEGMTREEYMIQNKIIPKSLVPKVYCNPDESPLEIVIKKQAKPVSLALEIKM